MTDDNVTTVSGKRHSPRDPNTLYLSIDGKDWSGWDEVRVTRGVERMPSDFDVSLTEKYPGQASKLFVTPGQSVIVRLGDSRVITGYVDRYSPSISPYGHSVRISGRGKCQDLVDCSAYIKGMSSVPANGDNAEAVITPFVNLFGISVNNTITDQSARANSSAPPFNINIGETTWEIIDRLARWGQFLCYEDTFGNLVMAQLGKESMASGVAEGFNIEAASYTMAYDQRFSDYIAYMQTTTSYNDQIDANSLSYGPIYDKQITRYRPKIIISEQTVYGQDIAQERLNWELARRYGRSKAVNVTCDSWRDSDGALWTPNRLIYVNIPSLKIQSQTWIIGEVTFRRDASGTHADLLLMPKEAYDPEPTVLQPFTDPRLQQTGSAEKDA